MFQIKTENFAILIPDDEAKNVIDALKKADVYYVNWKGDLEKRGKPLTFTFGSCPEEAPVKEETLPTLPPSLAVIPNSTDDIPF